MRSFNVKMVTCPLRGQLVKHALKTMFAQHAADAVIVTFGTVDSLNIYQIWSLHRLNAQNVPTNRHIATPVVYNVTTTARVQPAPAATRRRSCSKDKILLKTLDAGYFMRATKVIPQWPIVAVIMILFSFSII